MSPLYRHFILTPRCVNVLFSSILNVVDSNVCAHWSHYMVSELYCWGMRLSVSPAVVMCYCSEDSLSKLEHFNTLGCAWDENHTEKLKLIAKSHKWMIEWLHPPTPPNSPVNQRHTWSNLQILKICRVTVHMNKYCENIPLTRIQFVHLHAVRYHGIWSVPAGVDQGGTADNKASGH